MQNLADREQITKEYHVKRLLCDYGLDISSMAAESIVMKKPFKPESMVDKYTKLIMESLAQVELEFMNRYMEKQEASRD